MKRDNKTLDQIYDLFALRILVNSVKDCYAALGVVHELYSFRLIFYIDYDVSLLRNYMLSLLILYQLFFYCVF